MWAFFLIALLCSKCLVGASAISVDGNKRASSDATVDKCGASSLASEDAALDRMTNLPGFDQPLPSAWYSGYVDYELEGEQVHTHYVFIEAENPSPDTPVIYWSNGGPGASSLFGLLTELGPLILSDESLKTDEYRSTGIPTPSYNPYTWTRLGHILLIDQPAPVGFSYCNDEVHNAQNCGSIAWTDELTSQNAYLALRRVFETKFPCLQDSPLYLTGESYGGIYIPTLARQVLNHMEEFPLQLEGFAVGDGCLGVETNICGGLAKGDGSVFQDYWHVIFMAGHHQIPLQDFRQVMQDCLHSDHANFLTFTTHAKQDAACQATLSRIKKEIGGLFEYALYDECTYRNGLFLAQDGNAMPRGALNDYPCGGGPVMEDYFKLEAVKEAFHVKSTFFEVDNAEGDFNYTPTEPDLTGFYKKVNGKLRVLVYNGDTDPAITSFAAANWTSHMGFQELEHWSPWTIDGCQRMGGYVTRYEGGFDFLTIRGAGHMVPTYKPAATFAFIKAWIQQTHYPSYNANCTNPSTATSSATEFTSDQNAAEAATSLRRLQG